MNKSMRFNDHIMLALRNVRRQKLRNVLAISTIVIGATSITLMLALVTGAKGFYFDQFKNTGKLEQIIVTPQTGLTFEQSQKVNNCTGCTKLTPDITKTISGYKDVTGVSPTANVSLFESITLNGKKQVMGVAQSYQPNGVIQHTFVAGSDFGEDDAGGKIIIGRAYADEWGYRGKYQELIGKQIDLTTNSSYTGEGATLPDPLVQFKKCQSGSCSASDITDQLKPTTLKATIVGVEADEETSVFVPLKWANSLLQTRHYEVTTPEQAAYTKAYSAWNARRKTGPEPVPNFTLVTTDPLKEDGYSTLVVRVNNTKDVDAVASRIQTLGIGAVGVKDYINGQLQVFDVISLILGAMGGVALVVAAIGIINIMVMAILERTKEIGVLRALGAKRSTISRLFTLEASLLGFIGGVVGIAFGYGLIQLANLFINAQLAANGVVGRNIVSLPVWLGLSVVVVTTVVGMLAGLYPARRAARLDPVEALRSSLSYALHRLLNTKINQTIVQRFWHYSFSYYALTWYECPVAARSRPSGFLHLGRWRSRQ